ncbi:alcohol dehydrogenase [Vulcanimicrobium alpinum]|uniref:Alcohol dehydrogenase n=1 Tax=Vulcanimicrobium alpinum TaxID=3016050 RepID=A0AAN1XVQ4_UNVUL|nr:zinc-binding dehydrogenase [Vulcanimicrobium alpinum]BDE05167.1 alcohol dehydrogenase [Vulcanimicrobium alpinum]
MRAVRIHAIDRERGPEQFRVDTVDEPAPAPGEILVKIARAAFNRRDVFISQGLYPGIQLPCVPGSDGVGTVAAHGEGAQGPAVGTRVVIDPTLGWGESERIWRRDSQVLGMPHQGTMAEYLAVPAGNVVPAPASLSDDEAAAMPLGGVTAYRALVTRGGCTKDDVVLLPGIGSGVQTFALLFAKRIGAKVIVTSSSDEKLARAKALGADVGINYKTSEKWEKEVSAIDGGPSLIVDCVGGDTFAKALNAARYGARAVTYGGTTGDAKIRPFSVFWKQLDVLGSSMGSPNDFRAMLAMWDGSIRPIVDSVFPMDDIVAAAKKVDSGEQFGKVVVAVG